jgi:succinate-acetate transporter protein
MYLCDQEVKCVFVISVQVFSEGIVQMMISWVLHSVDDLLGFALCGITGLFWHFGGTCLLHLQGD